MADIIKRMRGAAVYRSGRIMVTLYRDGAKWYGIAYLDGRIILESRYGGPSRDAVLARTECAAVRARGAAS